jgi:putative SOS response-associated peptidase YedK
MCNLYTVGDKDEIAKHFRGKGPAGPYKETIAPLAIAPIIVAPWALRMAQWGMIPRGSNTNIPTTSKGQRMSTNNARREGIATAYTYRDSWQRGRRCLIPAESYDEPYWGTGKNIWWRFWRADETPWALAGIWSEWVDPRTGEVVTSYSMITQNCDGHPLLNKMHKPDKDLPPGAPHDKRAVVPIEPADWDRWLTGTVTDAEALIQLPPVSQFRHGAVDPAKQVPLIIEEQSNA